MPTITLHTSADPLVLAQNETVFAQRVAKVKNRSGDLVQLYTMPPATYSPSEGAPYGAGHCNFTTSERVGVVQLLDNWVRRGIVPGEASIPEALGTDSGLNLDYFPGPWPASAS